MWDERVPEAALPVGKPAADQWGHPEQSSDSMSVLSMTELYDRVFDSKPPLIEGLLYPGVYLFVGAPKLGKSFFMAQLGYHVSTGMPL